MPSHLKKKRKSQKQQNTSKQQQSQQHSLDSLLETILEYRSQDNIKQALIKAKLAHSKYPKNEEVLDMLSELYFECEQYEKCRDVLARAIEIYPEQGAQKFLMMGEMQKGLDSLKCYTRAIQIMYRDLQGLIEKEAQQEQLDAMKQAIAEALCSVGDLYMTDLAMEADAEKQCEAALQEAYKLNPTSSHVLQTLASCRISQQRPDDAKHFMTQLLDADKSDFNDAQDQFKINTGKILLELQMVEESCAVYRSLRNEGELTPELAYFSALAEKFNKNYLDAIQLLYEILPEVHGKYRSSVKAEMAECKKLGGKPIVQQWDAYLQEQKRIEKEQERMEEEQIDEMSDL